MKTQLNDTNDQFDELENALKMETERLDQCERSSKTKAFNEKQTANSTLKSKKRKIELLEKEVQSMQMRIKELIYDREREVSDLLEANRLEIMTAREKIELILHKKKNSINDKRKELSTLQGKIEELDLQLRAARKEQVLNPSSHER